MKSLTRLILSILSPWGVFTSVTSLAGIYTQEDKMKWVLWESDNPLFSHFENIQVQSRAKNHSLAYKSLKKIKIEALAITSDDIAHYYNNLACSARKARCATPEVQGYLALAKSKAQKQELIDAIEHNKHIVG